MAELSFPGLGRTVASFGFDRRKTWAFMAALVIMVAIGLGSIWTQGVEEQWGLIFILVVVPGIAIALAVPELRLEGPILLIGEEGILDRRQGSSPVAWPLIQEATIRRRALFGKGIRIILTNGARYDIELNLLAADPAEVMRHIQEQASRS